MERKNESVCFRHLLGKQLKKGLKKEGYEWLEMSLVICRKTYFSSKSCNKHAKFSKISHSEVI